MGTLSRVIIVCVCVLEVVNVFRNLGSIKMVVGRLKFDRVMNERRTRGVKRAVDNGKNLKE